jgi:hypothetical protein
VFTVNGALAGATCTATETVPSGYVADQTGCVGVSIGGSCTITNTLRTGTITVFKDFTDGSTSSVSVGLSCTSGSVAATPLSASEASPAVFTVNGFNPGATCSASETVPSGYTGNQSGCQGVPIDGSCTITNTPIPVVEEVPIPTLSTWLIMLLGLMVAGTAWVAVRRR